MNTWLLRELNAEAKAWPYHVGNRAAQRRSIKDNLQMVRSALAHGGYGILSLDGGASLHYAPGAYVTNCRESDFALWRRLGILCIDCRTADRRSLIGLVVNGPMISLNPKDFERNEHRPLAFQYISAKESAKAHREIGSIVYNLEG